MRFIAGGPILPDYLLEERDAGRVIFLCGAGVSIPSGMPTFVNLTKYVIDHFKPGMKSDIWKAFSPWVDPTNSVPQNARTSLDQIFNLLEIEYGRNQVGKLVAECLVVESGVASEANQHKLISKISSDHDGAPQIVTTNFDRLFESALADRGVKYHVPPSLPDLQHDVSVTGITYLHGRLADTGANLHDYVLSSADFGRAYLAQGWATAFIRQLLKKYTVVLLGYQAEDPPIKYLLQGLNSDYSHNRERLYAFDQGEPASIEAKWRDRGVTPIAYPESGRHQALWETLEAWATRADDPWAWKRSVIDLAAQNSPRMIHPHQRGMVSHVVKTALGAKRFADAEPSPSIEWLLVFDPGCRLAKPYQSTFDSNDAFDPSEHYGLDDDPPRLSEKEGRANHRYQDLIAWQHGDRSSNHLLRLATHIQPEDAPMPPRLWHLARWILQHMDQPTLAWWVARQTGLMPRLHWLLKRQSENSDQLSEQARKIWLRILDSPKDLGHDNYDVQWFQFLRRLKNSGWIGSTLRAFEAATLPVLKIEAPSGVSAVRPPFGNWEQVRDDEIANFDLHFPARYGERPDVTDEILPAVFSILQQNLIRATQQLEEIDRSWFELGDLYHELSSDFGHDYAEGCDAYVLWFLGILNDMAQVNAKLLRAYIDSWPKSEKFIFDKLRLYAWNKANVFAADEISQQILNLGEEIFWRLSYERELMFLLRGRWNDFSGDEREAICNKILKGPPRDDEDEIKYVNRKNIFSLARLGWLEKTGCNLSKETKEKQVELKNSTPEWRDQYIDDVAGSNESGAHIVGVNDDFSVLEGLPIDQIVTEANNKTYHSFSEHTDHRPFRGFVKSKPIKALRALCGSARNSDYPIDFWGEIIDGWPLSIDCRATTVLHERMRRFPAEVVFQLRWHIAGWLIQQFPIIANINEVYAYRIFDDLIEKLVANGSEGTRSSLGERWVGGELVDRSRKTLTHAINSPVGKAMDGLIRFVINKNFKPEEGLPIEFKIRAKRLTSMPGEGSHHAICQLSLNLGLLDRIDPQWVSEFAIPLFDPVNHTCEAAWNGYLYNDWPRVQSTFWKIKPLFMRLSEYIGNGAWNEESCKQYAVRIVQSALLASDETCRLSFDEVCECLRNTNQKYLPHVIWLLGRIGLGNENGWRKFVIPFIRNAWPKERRFQIESTSRAWVSLLDDTGECFPDVLNALRDFLRPIQSDYFNIYRFSRGSDLEKSLAIKFPRATLELLNLVVSEIPGVAPFNLGEVLDLVAEADPSVISNRDYLRLCEIDAAR